MKRKVFALGLAVVGMFIGTVAIGSFPSTAQPLPRVVVLIAGITTVVLALKAPRVSLAAPLGARGTSKASVPWYVLAAVPVCAAASAALFLLRLSRSVWLGAPGTVAAVVLLASAAAASWAGPARRTGEGRPV